MATSSDRILLTGGAGFIGSYLAEAVLHQGIELTILDNLNAFYPPTWELSNLEEICRVAPCEFLEVDICNFEALREAVRRARPDVIVHPAARAGVRPSSEQQRLYQQVDLAGTVNLLELCRELQVKKFIFGSSSSVYGATSRAPFSEDQVELRPISPYAATKLAGEMLCYTYAHLFTLPIVCLRFFTVYGPRQRPDLATHKFTMLIEKGEPLPIFGNGSTGRDYTFIDHIVAGVLSATRFEVRPAAGQAPIEVFNLGNSRPVKLSELVSSWELPRAAGPFAKAGRRS